MVSRSVQMLWTENDFERMAWHDARVWALGFVAEEYEFVLDLDYILEWVDPAPGEEHYRFWVAPATLVFENVTDLSFELEPYTDVSLDRITRGTPGRPRNAEYIGKDTDWLWDLDFHVGGIQFRSAGFKQYLRAPATLQRAQYLPLTERGGLSFARVAARVDAG